MALLCWRWFIQISAYQLIGRMVAYLVFSLGNGNKGSIPGGPGDYHIRKAAGAQNCNLIQGGSDNK